MEEALEEERVDAKEDSKAAKKEKKKKEKVDKKQEALKTKIDELEDRVKRQMAEFDNFRKRTEKEKSAMFETLSLPQSSFLSFAIVTISFYFLYKSSNWLFSIFRL